MYDLRYIPRYSRVFALFTVNKLGNLEHKPQTVLTAKTSRSLAKF